MDALNQIEIQNIRHIVGAASNFCTKANYYKTLTQDTNITNLYDEICNQATSLKDELTNML